MSRKILTTSLDTFKTSFAAMIKELTAGNELPIGAGVGCKGIVNPATTEVKIVPGTFKFLEGVRCRR